MGRASKWLRSLFGPKTPDSNEPPRPSKSKQRSWSFIRSFREKPQLPPLPPPKQVTSRPVVVDEDEQSKRAIAVAAATAAAADAAVAAARAAAVVVRLTSSGRSPVVFGPAVAVVNRKRGEWAAVKIQSAFRGYLARRALRALRGLVKLQALVRGNIVRKQATETLRCMHALVRVQERAQASRAIQTERSKSDRGPRLHAGPPPTPEKNEKTVKGIGKKTDRSDSLKKNSTKLAGGDSAAGWNWVDKLTEEHYGNSRGANRKAGMVKSTDSEKNAKILEVDPGKPHFNNKRNNHYRSSCSTVTSDQNSRSFCTMIESPSKDSTMAQLSATSPSSVEMQQCLIPLRFAAESDDCVDSPLCHSSLSRSGSSRRGPFTPSKSECSRSLFSGYSDYPSYMANTESSRAKVRSHSAPKQRPEFEKSSSLKRASAHGLTQHSGASSYKSSSLHANFASKAYPGSGRLDRSGMPIRM